MGSGKVDVHIYLSPDGYAKLKALADSMDKTYGEVVEELLNNALSVSCRSIALYEFLRGFLKGYVRYLILRKLDGVDPCSEYRENRFMCLAIDRVIKEFLRDLGLALKSGSLRVKDLLELR